MAETSAPGQAVIPLRGKDKMPQTLPSPTIPSPPSPLLVEPLIRAALIEDLGLAGDITTEAVVPAGTGARAAFTARRGGIVAGLACAETAFRLLDPALVFTVFRPDGSPVARGDVVATVSGSARPILTGERVALNFLCHLSGIATETARLAAAAAGHRARICCTRKTTPGLRSLEKYAVRAGGGVNHRFRLDDAILIKDNHIVAAGGVQAAVGRARQRIGHMVKIEIEIDTLAQLDEALSTGADVILCDNMTPDTLREAVARTAGRAIIEASGEIRVETAAAIAATGVDFISAGWITHSAPALDFGLDFA